MFVSPHAAAEIVPPIHATLARARRALHQSLDVEPLDGPDELALSRLHVGLSDLADRLDAAAALAARVPDALLRRVVDDLQRRTWVAAALLEACAAIADADPRDPQSAARAEAWRAHALGLNRIYGASLFA